MGQPGNQAIRALKGARWYVKSVMGDNHYQRYLAHRAAKHPNEPVLTEREYWKERHGGTSVTVRCC